MVDSFTEKCSQAGKKGKKVPFQIKLAVSANMEKKEVFWQNRSADLGYESLMTVDGKKESIKL